MSALITACTGTDYDIYVGDTSDIVYIRPEVLDGAALDGNWTCSLKVVTLGGTQVIAETAVTDKSTDTTEFKAYLTPTQTLLLTPGSPYAVYDWVIQLVNSTLSPPYVKETHLMLRVFSQGIS